MIEILEQLVVGKKSQETCEDGIIVTENHIAVIDGSTSKTHIRINPSESNGRFCMELVKTCIRNLPLNVSHIKFCEIVTKYIKDIYKTYNLDSYILLNHPEERLTCSAIVYSVKRKEVWMIGDCQCLIDGVKYENKKPFEDINAEKRSNYIHKHQLSKDEIRINDKGRWYIVNDIINSMKYQNISYAVIDGTNIYIPGVKVLNVEKSHEIVLASDGYPFLKPTLKQSEDALFHLLKEDPMCIRLYKATKGLMKGYNSFDDRAFIRFTI